MDADHDDGKNSSRVINASRRKKLYISKYFKIIELGHTANYQSSFYRIWNLITVTIRNKFNIFITKYLTI
jgi:hypothetical protein